MRITNLIIISFIISVLTSSLSSCKKESTGDKNRFEQLRSEAMTEASVRNFDKSDSIGRILFSEAQRANDDVYMAYGLICQSYYNYGTGEKTAKRKKIAEEALSKALETTNDTLISRAYNVVGCYEALYSYNLAEAIYYFNEAKKHAEATGARDFAMATECNISELYHSIGDTLGITYDLDIYKFAKETDNPGLMRSAAQHVAEHYMNSGNTVSKALPYILSIDSTERDSKYIHDRLMGDYYQTLNDYDKAAQYYRQAIAVENGGAGVYISNARLLNKLGKYQESLSMLGKAEKKLGDQSIFNTYKLQILNLRADNLRNLGRDHEALETIDEYISVRDSIHDFRNRQEVNKYRIRYELGKKELELAHSHASIRTRNIIVIAISLFAIIVIVSMVFYYRRRDKMLSVIIDRQRELNSLREQSLNSAESLTADKPDSADSSEKSAQDPTVQEDNDNNGISEAKINEIWSRIQHEITVNHIYRDSSLSRDIFAEKVGCNHTWFSQIIKEKSGLSYPQFMNQQRIEEALTILSDPLSQITHEELWRSLGFLSKATFYSSFKARMSMSPAEFRRRSLAQM